MLSEPQCRRFDQTYLQQQTWLHGPAVLTSDAPQLAPLRLTALQRERLAAFVQDWQTQSARAAQAQKEEGRPWRSVDLLERRQSGLQGALKLLDEEQQMLWPTMVGSNWTGRRRVNSGPCTPRSNNEAACTFVAASSVGPARGTASRQNKRIPIRHPL